MTTRSRRPWPLRASFLCCLCFFGSLMPARSAAVQEPQAQMRSPTDGVDRVYHDYSAEGDASSIELNPALLSAIDGLDLSILGYRALQDFSRGTGFGAFAAANFGFGLAVGLGVQYVDPRLRDVFDAEAAVNPALTKIGFGISAGDRERAGFGIAVNGVRSNGRWIRFPDLDIGTMFRVFNYGSVGVTARLSPTTLSRAGGLPGQLTMIGEIAVRPLGTHHLELAGGLRARLLETDAADDLDRVGATGLLPQARVAVRWQGLTFTGEAQQVNVAVLDPLAGYAVIKRDKAWRGAVGMEAAWDFLSVGTGVHTGVTDSIDGVGIKARFSTEARGRVYWPRPVDIERLEVGLVNDEHALIDLLERVARARRSGSRAVVLVDARGTRLGWAGLHELRQALIELRNSGGHVFAYVENATMQDYYVASVAEKTFIHPAGELEIYGLSSSSLYFADALAKIGVRVEAIHLGEYKSAHEPWTGTGPSAADREQRTELVEDTFGVIIHDIAQARGKTVSEVRRAIDDAPYGPDQAVAAGLVDKVVFRDQLEDELSDAVGTRVGFARFRDTAPENPTWSEHPYVAVVLVEGTIIDGESRFIPFLDLRFTGGDTIARTLRSLRSASGCRGIVLRVNSPGGSALASDVIWREVHLTRAAHQKDPRWNPPIVVSMGGVAASGGYYVAMGSDWVIADPLTITGSIGAVALHFDLSGLLQKLGIDRATFAAGRNPDIDTIFAPYTADQQRRMTESLTRVYDLFRARVAAGRKITVERVHELGRGRVYSGIDAEKNGLVDQLGGLEDAVALVRKKAAVPRWRELEIRVMPEKPTLLDLILDVIGSPFQMRGPVARRIRARQQRKNEIPLALDRTIARTPLSLLFLPQDRPNTLMTAIPELRSRR